MLSGAELPGSGAAALQVSLTCLGTMEEVILALEPTAWFSFFSRKSGAHHALDLV